jgi:hypothetical protein
MPIQDPRVKAKDEIRGSLRCAVHGAAVNSFGRDDGFVSSRGKRQRQKADSSAALRNDNKRTDNGRDKDDSRSPSGMKTKKTKAAANKTDKGNSRRVRQRRLQSEMREFIVALRNDRQERRKNDRGRCVFERIPLLGAAR